MAMPGNTRGITGQHGTQCGFAIEGFCTTKPTKELCTESDSFGDEWTPVCIPCLVESKRRIQTSTETTHCPRCDLEFLEKDLETRRDWEEGMHGPVYDMCPKCAEIWDLSDNIAFMEMDDENTPDPEVLKREKAKLAQLRKEHDERTTAAKAKTSA
jgi:Zn-finger nucleic acid-binding protein